MSRERQNDSGIIVIGQRFQVFPESATLFQPSKQEPMLVSSERDLRTRLIPDIQMKFDLLGVRNHGGLTFTPFSPAAGYRVDRRDFNPVTRANKIDEISRTEHPDFKQFAFSAASQEESLVLNEETEELIQRLRLQLFFPALAYVPRTTYEGMPDSLMAWWGERRLEITNFYPLDTGPLPDPMDRVDQNFLLPICDGGNWIGILPDDLERIHQIYGEFILTSSDSKIDILAPFLKAFQDKS